MSRSLKYGWRPDVPDVRDFRLSAPHVDESHLPTIVDLRDGFGPIWDQGDLGSCTGHGIAAVVQYENRKVHPQWDFMPSRLFIYYNEREIEGSINEDAGAYIRDGIKSVAKLGVCREDLCPYVISKFRDKPNAIAYKNALIHKALLYQRVPQTKVSIKNVLANGHPFVFGFTVYESFEGYEIARTGKLGMPNGKEKMMGGHAVVACGYNSNDDTVLVRNSWSARWGMDGYFTMPFDYILDSNLADDLWAITRMQ